MHFLTSITIKACEKSQVSYTKKSEFNYSNTDGDSGKANQCKQIRAVVNNSCKNIYHINLKYSISKRKKLIQISRSDLLMVWYFESFIIFK